MVKEANFTVVIGVNFTEWLISWFVNLLEFEAGGNSLGF